MEILSPNELNELPPEIERQVVSPSSSEFLTTGSALVFLLTIFSPISSASVPSSSEDSTRLGSLVGITTGLIGCGWLML